MRQPADLVPARERPCTPEPRRLRGEGRWERLPFFWFLLFLSYRCTRRCRYCYAFNQAGDDNTSEMDEGTFARLLEWIPAVRRASDVEFHAVSFLGGEPLLRTDRVRRVMEAVSRGEGGMQGVLYTNGDLVDSVRWEDLERIDWVCTNITDVGLDELERRTRIVGERSNARGQTLVATLDDLNLGRILDVTRFGVEHGYRLRYSRDLYRGLEDDYRRRLLARYHEICDLLEAYVAAGRDVHTTFLLDTLIPAWDSEESPYPCGKRMAAVYPDGTFGPCLRNHTLKTGTLCDPDPLARLQCSSFHHDLARPEIDDECRRCPVRTACQGGCPHDRQLLRGSLGGRSVVCDIHKEIIPRLRQLDASRKVRAQGDETPSDPASR